jgi:hypothetical protein
MIELDIIDCFDTNFVGEYQFYKNRVRFGQNQDIIYHPKEDRQFEFHLTVAGKNVDINGGDRNLKFHVNAKLAHFPYPLSKGDIIKIYDLEFVLRDFAITQEPSYKQLLKQRLDLIEKEDPELYRFLRKLS